MTRPALRVFLPLAAAALLAAPAVWLWHGNTVAGTTAVTVRSPRLPAAFSGFRIAQVSDLHNASFGEKNGELARLLRGARPDLIAVTGDLIEAEQSDAALALMEQAVRIAPVYYAPGNHEARMEGYPAFAERLRGLGVQVLENRAVLLSRDGGTLRLAGLSDPAFSPLPPETAAGQALDALVPDDGVYTLLLSHRPELLEVYAAHPVDLALSGHAHGGQVRLPGIGGLYAPNQGVFPRLASGVHRQGRTTLVVSRGLGHNPFLFRVNNPPELVLVTLEQG